MERIKKFIKSGFLVSPELSIDLIEDIDDFINFLKENYKKGIVVTNEVLNSYLSFLSRRKRRKEIRILKNFEPKHKKVSVKDFVSLYNDRYNKIKEIMLQRIEAKSAISIARALKSPSKDFFLIAMVREINRGKWVRLKVEDPSGVARVLVKQNGKVEELVEDEVIGISCTKKDKTFFSEEIHFPDVPERGKKKFDEEVNLCFIADIHYGSKMFLKEEFSRFLKWINGKIGDQKQKELAEKVKYIFVVGDLVDGVGVYPEQEKELEVKDIYQQYEGVAELLKEIPEEKKIIIIPGNHDALRIAEPQPPLYVDLAKPIYELKNVISLSNPTMVNIEATENFEGFNILLYHGYSLDYFVANVPKLKKFGYERPDLLMEFLLKKRHLAPTHGSTLLAPLPEDFLVIDKVPDIFVTAHIHKSGVSIYRNVLNICCSCWQGRTVFQEKVGHVPEPARVPVVNLKNLSVRLLKFI